MKDKEAHCEKEAYPKNSSRYVGLQDLKEKIVNLVYCEEQFRK